MKRYSNKEKLHFKRRSLYQLKKRRKQTKQITHDLNGILPEDYLANLARNYYIDVKAPENFKLQYEYCEEVLRFINQMKRIASRGNNISVHLEDVKIIGEGAIAMLLSVIEEIHKKGISIRGIKPKDDTARAILEKSGFFNFVLGKIDEKNRATKNTILKTGTSDTHQSHLSTEIKKSNDTIWGIPGRNPIVYGIAFEMMRNSCDHAFKIVSNIKWHFAISHDENSKMVKFSFVDNGKGIIKTFGGGLLKKCINLFKSNSDILETAFKDGIESRTGLEWRGQGLPTIYEAYEEGYIKNLLIITNGVFIHFDKNIIQDLTTDFSGSYYYWEVDTSCKKACFT